ncbi:MAG: spore coat associated protein CotJA [Anaerovoracaceae bacterium]
MIREPYIGMPITIGGTSGCMPGMTGPSRPPARPPAQSPARPPQSSGPSMPPGSESTGFDARLLGSLPIAMAYTPMQQWKTTYPQDTALMRGTVFPELDLPFEGITVMTERRGRGGMQP